MQNLLNFNTAVCSNITHIRVTHAKSAIIYILQFAWNTSHLYYSHCCGFSPAVGSGFKSRPGSGSEFSRIRFGFLSPKCSETHRSSSYGGSLLFPLLELWSSLLLPLPLLVLTLISILVVISLRLGMNWCDKIGSVRQLTASLLYLNQWNLGFQS